VWAGWIPGHTDSDYPVLKMGGIAEAGYVSVYNVMRHDSALASAPPAEVTYLLNEDFEGSGTPTSWTVVSGSPTFDYTTDPINGNKSMRGPSGSNTSAQTAAWTDVDGALIKFRMRLDALSGSSQYVMEFYTAEGTSVHTYVRIGAGGALGMAYGGTTDTSATMELETEYYIWVRYRRNTGGTNGFMSVAFATTDSEPENGTAYEKRENQGGNSTLGKIRIRSDSGSDIIIDDVQVTEWSGP
jgi:hypothetical protein